MTQKEAITILTEQQAVKELLALGWRKSPCAPCEGRGHFRDLPETFLDTGSPQGWSGTICDLCAGTGYNWEEPKT